MMVSFDWDNTITKTPEGFGQIKELAKKMVAMSKVTDMVTVKILTTRPTYLFDDVFLLELQDLDLTKSDVISTEGKWKYEVIDKLPFKIDLHFDDSEYETQMINSYCKNTKAVLVNVGADFMSLFDEPDYIMNTNFKEIESLQFPKTFKEIELNLIVEEIKDEDSESWS